MPSHQHSEVRRRTVIATTGYGAAGGRSAFGYWVPLAMTVTVATVGLAAWIWSERRDDEDESSEEEENPSKARSPGYTSMTGQQPPESSSAGFPGPPPGPPSEPGGYERGVSSTGADAQTPDDATVVGRMSGALRRTPSPQQSYDWASKKVAAGVAAAGAVVGGALTSIREGSQEGYQDHERWSEEADSRGDSKEVKPGIKRRGTADDYFSGVVEMPKPVAIASSKRRNVAVVVSAVGDASARGGETGLHPSILTHLREEIDLETAKVWILIYAPELKRHPLGAAAASKGSRQIGQGSTASSFSNISHGDVHTPGEFPGSFSDGGLAKIDPDPIGESSPLFKSLYNQALAIAERDTMIMPFTTSSGHLHLLRSLAPETVYIQETLCGNDGGMLSGLSGWVKQIVVVIGDEGGQGGLVDTEDEDEMSKARDEKWWQKEERTGLGRGAAVVESLKIDEDWRRRIGGQD